METSDLTVRDASMAIELPLVVEATASLPPSNRAADYGRLSRRLRRGGMWVVVCRSLGMLTVFVNLAILAKLLPVHDFASYVLAVSFVTISSIAAMCGLNSLVCRRLAARFGVDDHHGAARSLAKIVAIGSVTISGVAIMFWIGCRMLAGPVFGRPELAQLAGVLALWVALLAISQILAEIYRGLHNLMAASVLGGVTGGLAVQIIFLACILAAHRLGQLSFENLALMMTAALVMPIFVALIGLRFAWPAASDRHWIGMSSSIHVGELMREAVPISLLHLAALGMDYAGQVLLGAYGTDQQLAIFEGVWRIAFLGIVPLTMIELAISSTVSELHAQKKTVLLENVVRGASTICMLVSLPILITTMLFSGTILGLVFKPSFAAGASALVILCASQVIRNWAGPCHFTLIMTGHPIAAFGAFGVAAPILLFGPWAIGSFGLVGIATVVALASTTARLLQLLLVRLKVGIWANATFSPRFISDLLMAAAGRTRLLRLADEPLRQASA